MESGHVQKIAEWTKKYGDVIRVSLGERETVCPPHEQHDKKFRIDSALLQVFINSHKALAETVVKQGPAFQSRPKFKLFHSEYATSGIWTVGSKFWWIFVGRTVRLIHESL